MSNAFQDIRIALDARLATLSGLPPVAWPNAQYVPTIGTLFIRPTLLAAETVGGTLESDRHTGIYRVDVFSPVGVGDGTAIALLDSIGDHFAPMTTFTSGVAGVQIVSCSQSLRGNDGVWYNLSIDIRYLSYILTR